MESSHPSACTGSPTQPYTACAPSARAPKRGPTRSHLKLPEDVFKKIQDRILNLLIAASGALLLYNLHSQQSHSFTALSSAPLAAWPGYAGPKTKHPRGEQSNIEQAWNKVGIRRAGDSCTPTTPFLAQISETFHTCVPTPLALLSTTLGTLSIVSWLFAQLPQIYKNYKIQSTAGLSIFFLVEWCLGDLANLLGALFTEQATWQVIVAGYYVFVDVCLVTQYFWYTHFKPWHYERSLHSDNDSEHGDSDSDILNGLSPINSNFYESEPPSPKKVDMDEASPSKPRDTVHFNHVTYEKAPMSIPNAGTKGLHKNVLSSWQPGPSPRTVLYIATLCALISKTTASPLIPDHLVGSNSTLQITGTILSWFSTLLYLGSRLPQLYKNWQRRSTAGLSPLLFMAAFSGNFFYSTSLLTNPNAWNNFEPFGGHGWVGAEGSSRLAWISAAAPFFLGAAGVLGLDAAMGVQFMMYAERDEEKIVKVRDSRGHSQWQKVDGWMRGWVPSLVGKERVLSLAESQRLLSESREMSRSAYGTV